MAKTQEELNIIKKEVETLNNKLAELTDEELEQVTGGVSLTIPNEPLEGLAQAGLSPELDALEQTALEHKIATNQVPEYQQTIPVLRKSIETRQRQIYRNN